MRSPKPVSRRCALRWIGGVPSALFLAGCADTDGSEPSTLAGGAGASTASDGTAPAGEGSYFELTRKGDKLVIECNGLPNHATGKFPNANCPARIKPAKHHFEVAASPARADAPLPLEGWLFGVAINGVVFDPTGPFLYDGDARTNWEFEVMSNVARPHLGLDMNNAHCQPSGEYHYHGLPVGLLDTMTGEGRVTLIGYAADGFPIYGPYGYDDPQRADSGVRMLRSSHRVKAGLRGDALPGGMHDGTFVQDFEYVEGWGDLDECNGRVGVTPEYPNGIYHYVITAEFPFIPRAWRGTPDPTFVHGMPGMSAVPPALRRYRGTVVVVERANAR